MPEAPLTPEEKLLRIIESPQTAEHGSMRGMRQQPRNRSDFKLIWKLMRAKYGDRVKDLFNLKSVNAGLVFLAGLITLFLALDYWLGIPRKSTIEKMELLAKKESLGDLVIERLEPIASYLQGISERNIFSLPPAKEETLAQSEKPKEAIESKSFSDQFKVVGIIWSEAPQAIIEDSKAGRTFLVSRGGKVREARVKDILKDRVILSYDGQDIELR